MNAAHRLVGYDRQTELEKFEVAIPQRFLGEIRNVVRFDRDDPKATGCYQLTSEQARRIAGMVHRDRLPNGLDFFFEAYAANLDY
ncbi:hypothetical protein [Bradyrhizobium sp. SZCCHNRI1029]|uniref:DUF7683 domain-containing protein n=1 Tax=Bradyrhizobium sp. SZCCHNRI1029 TaxID=3057278 RepID=UPI0029164FE8|nr:hypothetical protein [Bradyrhizobium sp. SZCCHNRI1029]